MEDNTFGASSSVIVGLCLPGGKSFLEASAKCIFVRTSASSSEGTLGWQNLPFACAIRSALGKRDCQAVEERLMRPEAARPLGRHKPKTERDHHKEDHVNHREHPLVEIEEHHLVQPVLNE